MEKLRAYFFNNMYLQGIHAGVQSQHTTAEIFTKYLTECSPQRSQLLSWANEHKTTIVLNGGMSSHLKEVIELFENSDNPYPWAYFCESEEALNGAITNVGIIVPEKIWMRDKWLEDENNLESGLSIGVWNKETSDYGVHDYTIFERALSELITSKRLAQ